MLKARALLVDLDGTVYAKGELIPGVVAAIERLRRSGFCLQFLTNTDSRSASELSVQLSALGLSIPATEIMTAVDAALQYIALRPVGQCYCLLPSRLAERFSNHDGSHHPVRYVVVGDPRETVSYEALNTAFRHLMRGAELIALQKGRFFIDQEGCNLDTGAFVSLLEYAAERQAVVVGKPAPTFFEAALGRAGVAAADALVIGDDFYTDITGATRANIRSIWVRTGKYGLQQPAPVAPVPTLVLNSLADVPSYVTV